jgi:hypothetical protein
MVPAGDHNVPSLVGQRPPILPLAAPALQHSARQQDLTEAIMHSIKILIGRAVPGLLLLFTILFRVAPNASASVTYPFGASAQGSVGGGQIDQNCGGAVVGQGFFKPPLAAALSALPR